MKSGGRRNDGPLELRVALLPGVCVWASSLSDTNPVMQRDDSDL